MKTIINYLFGFICIQLISLSSFSQAPDWNTLGNATTNPSTDFVGTTDNTSLVFRTNSIEGMRLTLGGTGGFVGIGTTTPTRRLNVIDDIDLTPGTFPNSGYRWNDEIILKTDQIGNNIFLGLGCRKYQYFNI